jgi:uncharacterized protein with gpF-like domain
VSGLLARARAQRSQVRTLAPVRPNAGIRANYRRRLEALVDMLHASIVHWLSAAYRRSPPVLAQDESPARELHREVRKLTKRWQKRVNDLAPDMANTFASRIKGHTDAALGQEIKNSGLVAKFRLTRELNDAFQAVIGENISLIKSIAARHLADVEALVMRSVQHGRDLGELTKALEERYKLTRKRAAFLARDQNNKATSVINRARQLGLGITEAIWEHSAGGNKPRPGHVKAGREQKRFDLKRGAYIDGDWIFPGELPNCRCVARPVIPGFAA